MNSSSKFDIIVYGATGFTGQLVAEYLATRYRNDKQLKWAMAGRSLDKLKSVRDAIAAPADTPLIVADAGDPESLKAMVDQTKSVVTTVGPGKYMFLNGGKRYTGGKFPKGLPKFFDKSASISVYESVPASDVPPNYPCDNCPSAGKGPAPSA